MVTFNAFLTGLLIFSSRKLKKFRKLSEKEDFFPKPLFSPELLQWTRRLQY